MSCNRTGIETTDLDCHVCGFCEREYVKKVAGFQTIMPVECVHCRTIFDHKDGLGVEGVTSGTCPACMPKHHAAIGKES